MSGGKILALAGGVGGAKLARGLARKLVPEALTVVVNTGDDFSHFGLHVSPDLDTVMYTLAGRDNPETGWGLAGETWNFMEALEALGVETWFRLGDQDLATHVERTRLLAGGKTLSQVTEALSARIGVRHAIVPMSDDADLSLGQVEIQAIRMGDVGFVGVPAEYFVELQLDIKERSPYSRTFVSELANGCVGYVPTRKAFEQNMAHVSTERMDKFDHMGYEVRSALSRGFLPGMGEAMADAAVELLEGLAG